MHRRLALVLVPAVALGVAASPSFAAPKKKPAPIKKTYTATAPTPDPTPITGQTGGNCSPTLDTAKHEEAFAIPYAGTITIDLNGFQGDWALALLDSSGEKIADNDNDVSEPIDTPAKIVYKFKKKTSVSVRACNFAGGPTATVSILYVAK